MRMKQLQPRRLRGYCTSKQWECPDTPEKRLPGQAPGERTFCAAAHPADAYIDKRHYKKARKVLLHMTLRAICVTGATSQPL